MYNALLILGVLGGFLLALRGIRVRKRALWIWGITLALATMLFFLFLSFWGEKLWFDALGYGSRFWTALLASLGLGLGGALASGLLVHFMTRSFPRVEPTPHWARTWPATAATFIGALWGLSQWDDALRFRYAVSTAVRDPILGKDTGFYLFRLPFYDSLVTVATLLAAIVLAAAFVSLFHVRIRRWAVRNLSSVLEIDRVASGYQPLYRGFGLLCIGLGLGSFLSVYHLMYSRWGVVAGPGWVDVHLRRPGYTLLGVVLVASGLVLLIGPLARWLDHLWSRHRTEIPAFPCTGVTLLVLTVSTWGIALVLLPNLFQWLYVGPNELRLERPYLAHSIDFTRQGFDLAKTESADFPTERTFDRATIERNQTLLREVRLWDLQALRDVYRQFQEIRLYYQIADVDIDRYTFGDRYRQVMVSARELETRNLPPEAQTFVNRRFKYTHGYGLIMAPVSEFTPQGLPEMLVKDMPPTAAYSSLAVKQPDIYYGELTDEPVVVNTQAAEFDYPSGSDNVYAHYQGEGGVVLSSLWRKFLFGWKTDGTRLLFSTYPTTQSRILWHRQIMERVRTLAPFLDFDPDPYIVLADGRLYWMIDAYTSSDRYPYSDVYFSAREHAQAYFGLRRRDPQAAEGTPLPAYLDGANYVRNAVKVVIDAYSGATDFYVYAPEDPLIQVWSRIFPGMFKPRSAMPAALAAHIRYPEGYLLAQALVYAKYHMIDPEVFYNQEDLWVRATERYYDQVRPVDPYFVMWKPPGPDRNTQQGLEFILMQPFTPKNRQVLIGWLAGMCDGANYGRLIAYHFPKERRVLGTQQMETKIDQDSFLAGQLTLWDQRGSRVIRGNVLVLPLGDTLLYVEPIYLKAEAAAYPELRLVAVMHGDQLSYAPTFGEALAKLTATDQETPEAAPEAAILVPPAEEPAEPRLREASRVFERYLQRMGERRYSEAARELERLQLLLGEPRSNDKR